jgi:hypothetical protein
VPSCGADQAQPRFAVGKIWKIHGGFVSACWLGAGATVMERKKI